jgi:O-antigen/teichoic acid export membrane protein
VCVFIVLPILFFFPVTLGGKTMLPADNLFAWQPWASYARELGITVPHNDLLSDLVLENYVWKRFILNSLRARQLPLWNPYILTGVPFLAAGQHSAMYPLSVVFYVLPLPLAYGWFAALHLALAGIFTYVLCRTLRVGRVGSLVAGATFMFSGFMVTHNVFPMIIAAAVWLPLILAMIERIVARAEEGKAPLVAYIPDLVIGAAAYGMVFLAGHAEMYYYVALTSGFFALWRLVRMALRTRRWWPVTRTALGLLAMVCLGAGLGSAQWVPLLELVRRSFREGSATLKEVLRWAYPPRRLIALLVPDFFGNPSHHSYFDLFSWKTVPVTVNALGERIQAIEWGMKNYVEGACYVGVLPLLLGFAAVLRRQGRHLWFFALTAVLSLLFVFGSPIYALVYRLPGLSQVHSPFRWVYPYTLCMAVMAGMGIESLWGERTVGTREPGLLRLAATWAKSVLPWLALLAGLGTIGGLVASLPLRERFAGLAERALHHLAKAEKAFPDGRAFYSYEFRNLLVFGVVLAASGAVLLLRRRCRRAIVWGLPVLAVILAELYGVGRSFFPAVAPGLIAFRPPSVNFLRSDPGLYRITSYVGGDEKTLNANAGMLFDIADVRGYDSIIPRQYVDYMRLIQEQTELPYNRIAPIFDSHPEALDSPLLDLANVKYVLTTKERSITNQGYTLVYDGEMRIYRNEGALPRAFLVPRAISIPDGEARRAALRSLDPREVVILEVPLPQASPEGPTPGFRREVESIRYSPNEVTVVLSTPAPCYLVLADSYFPGWLAFVRPAESAPAEKNEQSTPIYRANGAFRAVAVPAGHWHVRFKYSPNSVKYGLYLSFLAGTVLILALALWGWRRFYRGSGEGTTVSRVTRNTVAPMALSLMNKVIDMAFAMLMLRILGPADAGNYYLAVVVIGWFDIFANFGLNTMLTREVAKDREQANRYLANTTILRMALCVVSVPVLGGFFLLRRYTAPLNPAAILAISLFGVALVPSNLSAGLSALFNAYERMEVPAFVTIVTTLLRVSLGVLALVMGSGYVGLAAVSIVVNVITAGILYVLVRRLLFRPRVEIDLGFQKQMLIESYPLMVNHLLATLFFKVAVLLLEWLLKDPAVVGWYSTAYKYVDAVGTIPAYFTVAIFPLMARFAATSKDSLLRAYRLAVKLLLIIAVPGAVLGSALAYPLIGLLGGSQYLPDAALILRVMIWYMPFGFINSVTQYVLIALNQQRFLTRAFAVGLAFNVLANLVLIPRFGYVAAAYVAVLSELALLVPFYVGIRRNLARIPWLGLGWKQAASAVPLAVLLVLLPGRRMLLSLPLGIAAYLAGLGLLQVFDGEEKEVVGRVLPWSALRGRLAGAWARLVDSGPNGR